MREEEIKKRVREGYARIATKEVTCCGSEASPCNSLNNLGEVSKKMGYTEEELQSVPEGANMGLGCGNPVALASLKKGETVIDLGSGAGFDCFIAAKKVGENGKIIGVDMTPEMLDKARENARKGNYKNVEFRLGEIENLPVANNTADIVISNCVINLSPDKRRVFEEAFRVLKPGGRLMVSDIVLLKELSEAARKGAHPASCVTYAIMKDQYINAIKHAGFQKVKIMEETRQSFEDAISDTDATVLARKPDGSLEEIKLKEAGEETKNMIEEIVSSTASIRVSAIKPAN
jgi:ubiquinone/menaquinone biosynthesis C-methylase UbiE